MGRLLGGPWVILGAAALAFMAGWVMGLRWERVSTLKVERAALEKTVARREADLQAERVKAAFERENASRAAKLAQQQAQEAEDAAERLRQAESATADLVEEFEHEQIQMEQQVAAAERQALEAERGGARVIRVPVPGSCPRITDAQWDRLLKQIPIGRAARAAAGATVGSDPAARQPGP